MFKKGDIVYAVKDTASLRKGEKYIVVDPCTNPKYIHEEFDGERCVEVTMLDGRKFGKYYEWKFKRVVEPITLPEDLFNV